MKNYLFTILLILVSYVSFGQVVSNDLMTTGKHIRHSLPRDLSGTWNCNKCENDFQIKISTGVKEINQGVFNVSMDALYVAVTRFTYKGKDISNQFSTPFELVTVYGSPIMKGEFIDPVTQNRIEIEITDVKLDSFSLKAERPEMDVFRKNNQGTILPKQTLFSK